MWIQLFSFSLNKKCLDNFMVAYAYEKCGIFCFLCFELCKMHLFEVFWTATEDTELWNLSGRASKTSIATDDIQCMQCCFVIFHVFCLRHVSECDVKEAVALYDFQARTKRELSFSKGDVLMLYERMSADWWEGVTSDDRDGLIPDKYVRIRHRFNCNFYFIKSHYLACNWHTKMCQLLGIIIRE